MSILHALSNVTYKNVFLEVKDDILAAKVEKAIGKYIRERKSKKIFVINREDLDKCVKMLKKKGISQRRC